jgi:dUTP pyrophosphatase
MQKTMPSISVQINRLPHGEGLPLPQQATPGSAGYDLSSAEDVVLQPMERKLVATGIRIAIPHGYECQIRPRSGLAIKHGISLPNTPATIDSDYRGEIKVPMINLGAESFTVTRGMRIAQMIFAEVAQARFEEVAELPESGRGEGGFGSTGS